MVSEFSEFWDIDRIIFGEFGCIGGRKDRFPSFLVDDGVEEFSEVTVAKVEVDLRSSSRSGSRSSEAETDNGSLTSSTIGRFGSSARHVSVPLSTEVRLLGFGCKFVSGFEIESSEVDRVIFGPSEDFNSLLALACLASDLRRLGFLDGEPPAELGL